MNEVHNKLPAKEQESFYAAGLPAQATASVVAAGRVASGQTLMLGIPQPSSNTFYLAWGLHFAYGSRDPATKIRKPHFIPTKKIAAIAAKRRADGTEVRLVSERGNEMLSLLITGDPRSADELAEIVGARITWEQPEVPGPLVEE
jgi:hypothetical protein